MKRLKLLTSLICTTLVAGATIVPSIFLTSCSNNKNNKYTLEGQTFKTSASFFGWDNIYIAIQELGANNKFNKVKEIINNLIKMAPNLFNNETGFDIVKITLNNNTLSIPITNNLVVNSIEVVFPKLNFSSLDIPTSNIYSIQANSTFFNMTLEEIISLDGNEILSIINQNSFSNIPFNSYIYPKYSILNNNSIIFYIFLPNEQSSVGILDIYLSDLSVPTVEPLDQIASLNINNDWEKIVNWQTPSIESTKYSYIDDVISSNLIPTSEIISTYDTAIKSDIVRRNFETNLYKGESVVESLVNDYYYCVKNLISSIVDSWIGSNLLDLNVYCGNNIIVDENEKIFGNFVLQFQNTTEFKQTLSKDNFYFNIDFQDIEIPKNGTIVLIINFNNSEFRPALSTESTINKTAYLTTAFNNLSIEIFSNDISIYKYNSSNNSYMFMPNSYSQSTIVKKVLPGNNILENTSIFDESYNTLTINDFQNLNKNYVQNELTKFKIALNSVQEILLFSATNPTIYDFITNINNEMYNLVYSLTNNKDIAKIVGNLFSQQNVSTFLYYNLDSIINVINSLLPESESKISLLNMLYDIKNSNNSPTEMKEWVSNLVSLKQIVEKVLSGSLGWLLNIISPLLTNISKDPNIFDCLLTMLPDILKIMSNQTGQAGQIGNSLLTYFTNLINFANTNDPDCLEKQIDIDKYKDIRVLDFIVNEFTQGNDNSLVDILVSIIGTGNTTINTIAKIVKAINFNMDCKIRVSFKNQILQTYNYENMNLYDVIKWVINSFFTDVKLEDGTTTDLYSAISNNLQYTYNQSNFSFNNQDKTISELDVWSFSLKQRVTINTLPIAALISKENVNIDLSSLNVSPIINSLVNILLNNALPVNLVINPTNTIKTTFEAINSPLFPVINNNELNWNYLTNNSIIIDLNNILNDSNVRETVQEKCYGSSYLLLKTLLPSLVSPNANINQKCWMSTDLNNTKIISNYNNSSYISELYVNQKVDDNTLANEFKTWVSDANNYTLQDNKYVINHESLNDFINKYFTFSSSFNNNNFASYISTITSQNYTLINTTSTCTLNILFPTQVLVIKPDNSCFLTNNYILITNV